MSFISSLSPDSLILISAFIALIISQDLDSNTNNVLGNLLQDIGTALTVKSAQQQLQQSQQPQQIKQSQNNQQALKNQMEELKQQIDEIKEQLRAPR